MLLHIGKNKQYCWAIVNKQSQWLRTAEMKRKKKKLIKKTLMFDLLRLLIITLLKLNNYIVFSEFFICNVDV